MRSNADDEKKKPDEVSGQTDGEQPGRSGENGPQEEPEATENDASERVGYCRPPRAHRFQSKISGNPSGKRKRPVPPMTDAEMLEKILNEETVVIIGDKRQRMINRETILRQYVKDAKTDPRERRYFVRRQLGPSGATPRSRRGVTLPPAEKIEFSWTDAHEKLFEEMEAAEKLAFPEASPPPEGAQPADAAKRGKTGRKSGPAPADEDEE